MGSEYHMNIQYKVKYCRWDVPKLLRAINESKKTVVWNSYYISDSFVESIDRMYYTNEMAE